jgi:hypothetical protein
MYFEFGEVRNSEEAETDMPSSWSGLGKVGEENINSPHGSFWIK